MRPMRPKSALEIQAADRELCKVQWTVLAAFHARMAQLHGKVVFAYGLSYIELFWDQQCRRARSQ